MTDTTASSSLTPLEVPPEQRPRHVAVIMDGNGRWAQARDLPRIEGHRRGVESVRRCVEECSRLHLAQLTLYCLSSENWKRPQAELDFLIHLLEQYMVEERANLLENNVRVAVIGRQESIPDAARAQMQKTVDLTSECDGLTLALAVNYGSRDEIVDAVRGIAREVAAGDLDPQSIDQQTVADHLYTRGMPDPDLVIRTAGEMRLSNYLLWQISYAELWVTSACWPEFREPHLHQAIRDYAARDRRFGGLSAG